MILFEHLELTLSTWLALLRALLDFQVAEQINRTF